MTDTLQSLLLHGNACLIASGKHLIFIDETWSKTNMTRLRGRAPVGERLVVVNGDFLEAFVAQVLATQLKQGDVVVSLR